MSEKNQAAENNSTNRHILIVEDEVSLAELMRDYLLKEGHLVTLQHSGKGVIELIQNQSFDVVLLDLMLPEINGIEICLAVRRFSGVPIIMTTAKVEEIDRIIGLELGANDYVCKPYSPRELVSRVKVQLRVVNGDDTKQPASLQLNQDQLTVSKGDEQIDLTVVEFNLLDKLSSQPARVFNRDQLMDAVYSDGRIVTDRTIDSHIKKIRKKLKILDSHDYVQAVYGCGYKFLDKP